MSDSATPPPEVDDLPPSAIYVYRTLLEMGEARQKELAEETWLSKETVRGALRRLRKAGLVEWRVDMQDSRRRLYSPVDSDQNAR